MNTDKPTTTSEPPPTTGAELSSDEPSQSITESTPIRQGVSASIIRLWVAGVRRLKASDKISLLALLVSISTVYLGERQFKVNSSALERQQRLSDLAFREQRKHDSVVDGYTTFNQRMSVRPYLQTEWDYLDNGTRTVGIFLHNVGIGPAIITSISMRYKGVYMNSWEEFFDSLAAQKDSIVFKNESRVADYQFSDSICLFQDKRIDLLVTHRSNVASFAFLQKMIDSDITVDYNYHSLYGENFPISNVSDSVPLPTVCPRKYSK